MRRLLFLSLLPLALGALALFDDADAWRERSWGGTR